MKVSFSPKEVLIASQKFKFQASAKASTAKQVIDTFFGIIQHDNDNRKGDLYVRSHDVLQ